MEAEVSRIISKLFVFCTSAPERTFGLRSSGGLAGIIDAQPASKAKHMTHAINGNNFLAILYPPSSSLIILVARPCKSWEYRVRNKYVT